MDQADLDVYLEVLHQAQQQGRLGTYFPVTAYGILKAIGRPSKGKQSHRWLKSAMLRMVACAVEITVKGRYTYAGSLADPATKSPTAPTPQLLRRRSSRGDRYSLDHPIITSGELSSGPCHALEPRSYN